MSEEHDDALRIFNRLNQARANNGGNLTKEEWLRIQAEEIKAIRDSTRREPKTKRVRGERDPLFDTLAETCGINLKELTKASGRATGTALAGIRTATPDVTPEEIKLRVLAYKRQHPTWAVTPKAIEKNWPTLGTGRATAAAAATDPRIAQGAPKGWQDFMRAKIDRWMVENPNTAAGAVPGSYYLAQGEFFKMPASWQAECWSTLGGQ